MKRRFRATGAEVVRLSWKLMQHPTDIETDLKSI
jgi:hypothetical protein